MMNLFKHPGTFTIGYLLLRLLLFPLSPVPGAVALDPLWVAALLLQQRGGKGWMFSLLPGLIFGDWMCGMAAGQLLMRAAGFLALGLLPLQGGFHRNYFFLMSAHALWSSLMPDWQGNFPLGYVYTVWMLQGLLWWGLAAPREEALELKPRWPLLVIPGGLLLLHLVLPSPPVWPLPGLGDHSGLLLQILAAVLLLPPFASFFLQRKTAATVESPAGGGGRWTHLAE